MRVWVRVTAAWGQYDILLSLRTPEGGTNRGDFGGPGFYQTLGLCGVLIVVGDEVDGLAFLDEDGGGLFRLGGRPGSVLL